VADEKFLRVCYPAEVIVNDGREGKANLRDPRKKGMLNFPYNYWSLKQKRMKTSPALVAPASDPPTGSKVSFIWFPPSGANPHYRQSPVPKLQAPQIKPYDLAIALTLMEGDNYNVLTPPDYLAFLRKHLGHNPIEDFYNTNNKIIIWIKSSILHYEKTEKRSEVLKFFINAALVGENLTPCRSR